MNVRNVVALILAIVVGIVIFKIIIAIFEIALALAGWLIAGAVLGGIIYLGYRKFNSMLNSGKRLT